MPKTRKMLTDTSVPYIQSLMRLIETQSKETIVIWCTSYAWEYILPIYTKCYPNDLRPRDALAAARDWLDGKIKLPEAKNLILACHAAAREAENNPAARAAARAIGQASSTIHSPAHSLGIALYGALAIACDRLGTKEKWEACEKFAADECRNMESALRKIAVENEPNPARLMWNPPTIK